MRTLSVYNKSNGSFHVATILISRTFLNEATGKRNCQTLVFIWEEKMMANRNINKAGKVAIVLAVIAGVLSLSRAIYNYTQLGDLDIIKIALGIGIPGLMYALVKSAPAGK